MKPIADKPLYVPFKAKTTILLLMLVIGLALLPMFFLKNAEFAGADKLATAAISEIAPNYIPWITPLWTPPSGEIESLLFAAQAALGAGVMGYFLGLWKGRTEKADDKK